MGFQDAIRSCLSKYATFAGRAPRSEYWWFILFGLLVNVGAGIVDLALFGDGVGIVGPLLGLALLLPNLAVSVRRLHDVGRSGWWFLLIFIPLIGFLVLLFWFVSRGDTGSNAHGPDPLPETAV